MPLSAIRKHNLFRPHTYCPLLLPVCLSPFLLSFISQREAQCQWPARRSFCSAAGNDRAKREDGRQLFFCLFCRTAAAAAAAALTAKDEKKESSFFASEADERSYRGRVKKKERESKRERENGKKGSDGEGSCINFVGDGERERERERERAGST